jgi:HPt (histidine-containing phosphotransfer) domain-containing protein
MTANAMLEDREACFAAGMDEYVAKPIRPEALAEALRQVQPRDAADAASSAVHLELEASALDSLRALGGDDFLAEMIDEFLADAPKLLTTLRGALEGNEADELRRAAHTLKSNGATFGAGEFSERCGELEERAKNGELTGASELIDGIERKYGQLHEALGAIRPGTPS